jgi:hypothetical protein
MKPLDSAVVRWRTKVKGMRQGFIDGALDLRQDLARGNPLLTGRSSASWNAASGAMNASHKGPDYDNPGEGRIQDGEIDLGDFKLGETIHVSNTVPYIQKLEGGSSMQKPKGWIKSTTAKHGVKLPRAIRKGVAF